jgi:hypothetical protein
MMKGTRSSGSAEASVVARVSKRFLDTLMNF